MISITKLFDFEAAHFLPNHEGKCRRVHGHSYKLEVTISGELNEDTNSPEYGMLIDFGNLSRIVKGILEKYDHHFINEDIPNLYPTAEKMVVELSNEIQVALNKEGYNLKVKKCNLWENTRSYATFSEG